MRSEYDLLRLAYGRACREQREQDAFKKERESAAQRPDLQTYTRKGIGGNITQVVPKA